MEPLVLKRTCEARSERSNLEEAHAKVKISMWAHVLKLPVLRCGLNVKTCNAGRD